MATKRRSAGLLAIVLLIFVAGFALGAVSSLSPKEARNAITSIPGFEFDPALVRIKSINPAASIGSAGSIVEAQFSTAFRLEKKEKWQVAEVRLGNGRWENVDLVVTAVRNEKIKRTRELMQTLAGAIDSYRREQGYYPRAKDIVELTDQVTPRYLNTLIRNDLWFNFLQYSSDGQSFRLQSLGPDGKPATNDEISLENGKFID